MKFLFCLITIFDPTRLLNADPGTVPMACPTADQCARPHLATSLKIYYPSYIYHTYSGQIDTVSRLDSFAVKINGDLTHGGCTFFKDIIVYRDQSLLFSKDISYGEPIFNLMGLPGHYKISCNWQSPSIIWELFIWEFDLVYVPPPPNVDTSATIIPVVKEINPNFLFYPNPATDILFIENESDPIQSINVFTSWGELFISQTLNTTSITIPLAKWPRGIYFLLVSTLTDKPLRKKIVLN